MKKKLTGFFADFHIKLLCFLFALGTVFLISYGVQSKRVITLPLEVVLPTGYKAVSYIPDRADVIVQGTEDRIYMVNAEKFSVKADFTAVNKTGVSAVPVIISYDGSEDSLNFSEITVYSTPSTVKVYFETL